MLKFYNTLTRKKQIFQPIEKNIVKIYTCGPTVYNYAHIGNLSAYLFADLLKRYLRYSGYKIVDVMNLTDVDDKTINASQDHNQSLRQYTSFFINTLLEDFEKLNITNPKVFCRATEHISEMINLVQDLIDKGYAYQADDGSVYYKIDSFGDYGKFAQLKKNKLKNNASGRMISDEYKKEEATDFVLWKKLSEKDGEVYWDSPFGRGRPGWHIECSAMSMKYLGETFDIHTGAIDLIFPHHQNEIAQSEAATGKQFVHFWLHRSFLKIDGKKMSKSLRNIYTLKDILKKISNPLVFRYLVLTNHYRSSLNFTFDSLEASLNSLNRFQDFIDRLTKVKDLDINDESSLKEININIKKTLDRFKEYMDDDLNTPKAIADLFCFMNKINKMIIKNEVGVNGSELIRKFIKNINEVWGFLDIPAERIDEKFKNKIENLIQKRNEYRLSKNWEEADKIKNNLLKIKVAVKDGKETTEWKIIK
ncbi:cysteine--tRNA ligase [Candidatus Kuenenbacteria bacterium CG08_land_8_20_14_0_20_37_23]|uniref:Cysteine--tRNA ligase n=2 Tax=Candidatus Kueneniibacteriota TaxID=1752740 RepID=A0A2M6XSU2_9BACT|nr:MAG: cysteine--tRNA ligase [Candidatus Kuenenbacteria bacterium CG1_02_38_13]PIU10708.1 MAG: cysteine--tRNA ligase [Candidatus Kuenenbacteria bacterium CG08_land_8_20_14_0_20_37_23]